MLSFLLFYCVATDEDSWESIDIEFDSSDFENDSDESDSV